MNKIFSGFLLTIALTGCSDLLQEEPKSLASENFYNTAAEAKAAVNAIYGPMRGDNAFSMNYPAQLEGLADYGDSRGTQTPVSLYQGLDNTNINRVGVIWDNLYQSVRNANLVISNVPKGTSTSDVEKAAFVAEAKYLRSLIYFAMVRNWAAIPIRTEANMTVADVPRSSVEDVYKIILSDALEAEQGLPDVPTEIGRPTKWAAKTLLSEIYMYQSDWTSSSTKAKEVIDANKYSLVEVSTSEDFQKIYGPEVVNTSEEIFYFKYSRQQGFGLVSYAHRKIGPYNYWGPGGVYAQYTDSTNNSIIKKWDNKDLRKAHILYNVDIGLGTSSCLFRKYRDPGTTAGAANDYPWYRYADLLLFHAETAARAAQGPTADALESLNKVRRRGYGLPSKTPSTMDLKLSDFPTLTSFVDRVVQERGYETIYEGKRWNDLKRLGIAKQRILEVKKIVIADKHMLWPIPNSELLYNKAIKPTDQNPGY